MNIFVKQLYALSVIGILAVGQQAVAAAEKAPAEAAKPKAIPLSGKVLETMDGGGYTYIYLQNGPEKVWVAAPQMKVRVGQEIALVKGFEMKNFTSKGLNRKFDRIIFSAGVANTEIKLSPAAIKMAHKGVPMQEKPVAAPAAKAKAKPEAKPQAVTKNGQPKIGNTEQAVPTTVGHVAKAQGKNAYTVAELYAKKGKLEKKQVVVRGKIVKVTPHIMKRNWIHIQDGTGSKSKKNNNLVVTTKAELKEGQVVTVKGTLYSNIDFGYGYSYKVLVDNATVN